MTSFSETPFALAISVTDWADFTAAAVTVNPAVPAPWLTVMDAGTVTAALLLERETVTGADAAAVR
jgi:hypothetical protein